MSALGRKQPFRDRARDSLDDQVLNVCFRPEADIRQQRKSRRSGVSIHCDYSGYFFFVWMTIEPPPISWSKPLSLYQ
jgi:hypothetical protein